CPVRTRSPCPGWSAGGAPWCPGAAATSPSVTGGAGTRAPLVRRLPSRPVRGLRNLSRTGPGGRGDQQRMDVSVKRLKRTRAAQLVKRTVLRRGGPNLPRLSVVVPFHDAVGQLEACVESLLAQTHPHLEILLVDDGSVDGSADIARDLAR